MAGGRKIGCSLALCEVKDVAALVAARRIAECPMPIGRPPDFKRFLSTLAIRTTQLVTVGCAERVGMNRISVNVAGIFG